MESSGSLCLQDKGVAQQPNNESSNRASPQNPSIAAPRRAFAHFGGAGSASRGLGRPEHGETSPDADIAVPLATPPGYRSGGRAHGMVIRARDVWRQRYGGLSA